MPQYNFEFEPFLICKNHLPLAQNPLLKNNEMMSLSVVESLS